MSTSKKYKVRLIICIPLIFFGITILTANITYYLTLHYVKNSVSLNAKALLDTMYLFRLKFWVVILAFFSFLCGFGLIYVIIRPIQKLIQRAEDINHYHNFSYSNRNGEIEYFYSIFDEVLTLLKSFLKEKEMKVATPLLGHLKRAEQLAVLGYISHRIAHEFRNPLGCIQGFVELIKKDIKDGDTKKVYLDTILQSIRSMNLLVEDLIEFSQPCTDISEFKDINQILGEVVQTAQKEFSHQGVEIRAKFQEDLPIVKTNPQKVHTAFLHIFRNMLQFAKSGEEITITTSGKPVGLVSTGFISIHFSNKRAYIPYEDTYSIFLPFSVIQKKKIGLGLSIAQHIISAHGGDIWVESDRDLGTTFIIELPSFKNVSIDFIKKEMALQQENY